MPELPEVPYQLPALQGRPEWMHREWVEWFRVLKRKVADLTATGAQGWTDVSHDPANFTGAGTMTWTVDAGDVTTLTWKRERSGDMTVAWYMGATSVGGVLNNPLKIKIPDGRTAAKTVLAPLLYNDAGAGNTYGFAQVVSGQQTIDLYKIGSNWSASAGVTSVFGQITFPTTT